MKKFSFLYIILSYSIFLISCDKEKAPEGGFTWYGAADYALYKENPKPNPVQLGSPLVFVPNSEATKYSIWPGIPGHEYQKRNLTDEQLQIDSNIVSLKNTGLAVRKQQGEFRSSNIRFNELGTYTVYFVSTNVYDNGNVIKETVDSAIITLIDTIATIFHPEGLESPLYRFVITSPSSMRRVTPEQRGNVIVLEVPAGTDVSSVSIVIRNGRATFTVDQGTITQTVNGPQWTGSLTTDRIITVTSGDGTNTNEYILRVVELPAE